MLNLEDPLVDFKLGLLRKTLPADSVAVFGDMYVIDGGYSEFAAKNGAGRVVLVDSLETAEWQRTRLENPALDFYKGDFSDPFFMATVRESFSVSVAFEILLHQAPLLQTLHDILVRTTDWFVFAQPMLTERTAPNSIVYLPGSSDPTLYPLPQHDGEYNLFDVHQVNHANWLWGLTPSFLKSALVGEGFEIVEQARLAQMPNPQWMWWGALARRVRAIDGRHWSSFHRTPGLPSAPWGQSSSAHIAQVSTS